jgi:hypothetical protein
VPQIVFIVLSLVAMRPALAQPKVDAANSYQRIICVVPWVGSGTWSDPKRPMFAPLPSELGRGKSGILAFYHEPSDDGQSAILVLVAVDRTSLQSVLSSTAAGVQVFDISNPAQVNASTSATGHAAAGTNTAGGTSSTAPVTVASTTTALQAVRKDFDWNRFAVRVQ